MATNNLGKFVHGRNRGDSPQPGPQQRPSSRAEKGARAKIQIGGQGLRIQPQKQQNQGQNVPFAKNGAQIDPQPQYPKAGDFHDQRHDGDRYDTDADSLDTSTMHGSVIHDGNNQLYAQQPAQTREPEEESGSEEEEGYYDEIEEDATDNGDDHVGKPEHTAGLFDGGNSYPSTTSGLPDDLGHLNPEIKKEVAGDTKPPDPAKMQTQDLWKTKPVQPQPFQRKSPYFAPEALPKQSFFQQGQVLRNNMNTANAANSSVKEQISIPRENQPTTIPQATREPVPGAGIAPQNALPQARNLPERGSLRTLRRPATPPVQASAPTLHQAHTSQTIEPASSVGETRQDQIEDYDLATLYKMSYESLKIEEFDKAPRGSPQVLSDDMQKKPLGDRLQHVHEKLGEEDKIKFIHSLSIEEWEDAGQWFVDRFSDIVKQTTQARQAKRKLARDFEAEVEQRYRHVEKRQQTVEDALSSMQRQGETLVLTRSPRASREPRNV